MIYFSSISISFILSGCSLCATTTLFLLALCSIFRHSAQHSHSYVLVSLWRRTIGRRFLLTSFWGKCGWKKEQQPKTDCVWGMGETTFEEYISFYHLGRTEDRTSHIVYLGGTFWIPLLTFLFLPVCPLFVHCMVNCCFLFFLFLPSSNLLSSLYLFLVFAVALAVGSLDTWLRNSHPFFFYSFQHSDRPPTSPRFYSTSSSTISSSTERLLVSCKDFFVHRTLMTPWHH